MHAPPGNTVHANAVGRRTRDAGIAITAYASYYRLDASEQEGVSFASILDTAVALGAPVIRVWAGSRMKEAECPDHRKHALDDALRIAGIAKAAGRAIAFEYHSNTFADTPESAEAFLADATHPAIFSLWQPPNGQSDDCCVRSLEGILARLHHVHVFHWWPDAGTRLPLAAGEARWRRFLKLLEDKCKVAGDVDLLLEFVAGDSESQLLQDAA
ncbi:MAG: TIM barrel protein, partial [Opitutaceae bacterium]|nr:TIM barrel protein [Opitutaceae bacterium]